MATRSSKIQLPANRKKKLQEYKSFRLTQKITVDRTKPLPKILDLWRDTWLFLWKYKKKMLLFALIYTVVYALFIKGLSGFTQETVELKEELSAVGDGNIGRVITFLALYATLISSLTADDELKNFYMVAILVIFSLAFIWLIRKLHGREVTTTVKDSFYRGMGPLIPFLGVIFVMMLEIVPAGLGGILLSTAQSSGVVTTSAEILAIGVVALLAFVLSIYLLSGSIFALYIVTLPSTPPIVAVRSSMRLLRIHRWRVLYRIIVFYILLLALGFVLVMPFIVWFPQFAEIAFFIISCGSFAVMHTYLYKLYRSML